MGVSELCSYWRTHWRERFRVWRVERRTAVRDYLDYLRDELR